MKKPIVILILGLGLTHAFSPLAQAKSEKNTSTPISVQVAQAKYLQLPDSISSLGTMAAIQSSNLSFSVSGHVASILFKSGNRVSKDDVIATLDDADVQSKLASLKANLGAARSKYERYQLLKDSGVFSKQDMIEVATAYKVAQANYASALNSARNLKLQAPFSGTLGAFKFSVGAYVGTGDSIVNLVKLNPLKVDYSFDQNTKKSVKVGQQVEVTTEALPGRIFKGQVTFISPTQDTDTGRFNLEAKIPNPDLVLSPGFFVTVTQIIDKGHQAIVVPQTAIVADQNQTLVYKVVNNKAIEQTVTLGRHTNNGLVEVIKGLNVNEQVVNKGTQKLENNSLVRIVPHAPPQATQQTERAGAKTASPQPKVPPSVNGKTVNSKSSALKSAPNVKAPSTPSQARPATPSQARPATPSQAPSAPSQARPATPSQAPSAPSQAATPSVKK